MLIDNYVANIQEILNYKCSPEQLKQIKNELAHYAQDALMDSDVAHESEIICAASLKEEQEKERQLDPSKMRFIIDHIFPNGKIIGRNGDEDIPVGSIFTCMIKGTTQGKYPNYEPTKYEMLKTEISLKLKSVYMYEKKVDQIPTGHTAALEVEGDISILKHALADLKADNECISIGIKP